MTKASDWAQTSKQEPVFWIGMKDRDGRFGGVHTMLAHVNRVGGLTLRKKRELDPAEALRLGKFLVDNFGESTPPLAMSKEDFLKVWHDFYDACLAKLVKNDTTLYSGFYEVPASLGETLATMLGLADAPSADGVPEQS